MGRAGFGSVAIAVTVLATTTGHAANPDAIDILGLRLGMAEPQVDNVLRRQVLASRITRKPGPCQDKRGCDVTIMASTLDGTLTIRLTADESDPRAGLMVAQIAYTLNGKAMGEDAMIRSSILERFGPPTQAVPMAWCKSVTASGTCRPDQPSLHFSPESRTLVLTAGSQAALEK